MQSFKTIERSNIHSFYLDCEEDDEDEGEDEGDVLVEEDVDMIEINYSNGNNEVVKVFNQYVLFVTKQIVFMLLDNAVISVFVKIVIKVEVILIY